MSKLQLRAVYGFGNASAKSHDGTFYLTDDNSIIYWASSCVIVGDLASQQQRFITTTASNVRGLACTRDRKLVSVWRNDLQVTVYDVESTRPRQRLDFGDIASSLVSPHEVAMCDFSTDGAFLFTMLEPTGELLYWNWERNRVLARLKLRHPKPLHISFSPTDMTHIYIVDSAGVYSCRYFEGALVPSTADHHQFLLEEQPNAARIVRLLSGRLAVAADCQLVLMEAGSSAVLQVIKTESPIVGLQQFHNGLLLAEKRGVTYYKFNARGATSLDPVRTIPYPAVETGSVFDVQSISCSPAGDLIAAMNSRRQVYILAVEEEPREAPQAPALTAREESNYAWSNWNLASHDDAINGMATCIRKPWLVTISKDETLRIFDYVKNCLELFEPLGEEPLSVSLHPAGHFVIVGFHDRLALMDVAKDGLRLHKDISARMCRECAFSNGGQMFAAVNGSAIQVFNTWTCECLATLKAHTGKIRSMYWSRDDMFLISAGNDGAVYSWSRETWKRENESIIRGCSYNSAICTSDGFTVYAVGSDKSLREIRDSTVTKELALSGVATQVALSFAGATMVLGMQSGAVRVVNYPLESSQDFTECATHCGPVSFIKFTHDDRLVFSAGPDGSIAMHSFSEDDTPQASMAEMDDVLVTKSDLDEIKSTIRECQNQLEELKVSNEYQLRLKDIESNEKIREHVDQYVKQIDDLKLANTLLSTATNRNKAQNQQQFESLVASNTATLQEQETSFHHRLLQEYERFEQLQRFTAQKQTEFEANVQEKEQEYTSSLQELTADYESRMQTKIGDLARLEDEKSVQVHEFNEMRQQIEQDVEAEFMHFHDQFQARLQSSINDNMRIKGENGIMKKKFVTLQKDIQDKLAEIRRMSSDHQRFGEVIGGLEREIISYKKEIQDRDEFIQEKERRVFEMKKANQELEKFRFVLENRIQTLRGQIEPKDATITERQASILTKSTGLESYFAKNIQLEKLTSEYRVQLAWMNAQVERARQQAKKMNITISAFKRDLELLVIDKFQCPPRELQSASLKLHQLYCGNDSLVSDSVEVEQQVHSEWQRQKAHLHHVMDILKQQNYQATKQFNTDKSARLGENQFGISELISLRKQIMAEERRLIVEGKSDTEKAGLKKLGGLAQ